MSEANDARVDHAAPVTAEAHLAWVLERLSPVPSTTQQLADSFGMTLAADVASRYSLPLWNSSAMDGYAVRYAGVVDAHADAPAELRVIGEVAAGSDANPDLGPGDAVRIMTGAPVPDAADTVIKVEDTVGDRAADAWADARVRVRRAGTQGANIRRAGEDVVAGSLIARAGDALNPARFSALAAAGITDVLVHRKPRVAVVVTGAELQRGDQAQGLRRGQIPESNSLLLTGLLRDVGIEPSVVHHAPDDAVALRRLLDELAPQNDLIVTTGGVGPGTHDIVRIVADDEPEVRAVRVAVRPGQPQCSGRLRGGAFLCALPGNPVSAAVSFELFVRPALLHLQGRRRVHRPVVRATAESGWRGVAGRLQVVPVTIWQGDGVLRCTPAVNPQGMSHAVGGHGSADGYAMVPAERGDVAPGATVDVIVVSP